MSDALLNMTGIAINGTRPGTGGGTKPYNTMTRNVVPNNNNNSQALVLGNNSNSSVSALHNSMKQSSSSNNSNNGSSNNNNNSSNSSSSSSGSNYNSNINSKLSGHGQDSYSSVPSGAPAASSISPGVSKQQQFRQNFHTAYMNMVPTSKRTVGNNSYNSNSNSSNNSSNGIINIGNISSDRATSSPAVEFDMKSNNNKDDNNNIIINSNSSGSGAAPLSSNIQLNKTTSIPSAKTSKKVRFSEVLTHEVEISSDIYMIPGQLTSKEAKDGFVNKLQKAIINNNRSSNNGGSSRSDNSGVMNGYESINSNIPYSSGMSLVAKKSGVGKRASTPMPTRPSLSEQLGAITAQASAITLDLKKKNPTLQGAFDAINNNSSLIFTCPVKDLVVGSLHAKYPAPVSFYNDHLEFVFHHPFASLEVTMIMYYKDLTSTSLLVGTSGGKFSFKILKKMAAFPSSHDYDPSNPMHAVSIEFCTVSSAHDVRDKIINLLRK